MDRKYRSFTYFFAWLVIGIFLGLLILLIRGDISLHIHYPDSDLPATETTATPPPVITQVITSSPQTSYSDAVVKAVPAVVSIKTIIWSDNDASSGTDEGIIQRFLSKDSPDRPKQPAETSSGSGVIINNKGYILTNYHVIANRDALYVRLNDNRTARAKVIGSDPETDLAVLKIELKNLPTLNVADIRKLRVGDIVLAIGYPFAIGQSVTQGIISATGRTSVSQNTYENFIQTDAAVNPGNSGGALINTKGEIVGINSNIYSSTGNYQGISFSIPIDLAQQVANQIIENGYVVRGWLGVEGQELTQPVLDSADLERVRGILITDVDKSGPGDLAGIKNGDIITRINQKTISGTNDILNLIAAGKPGDEFLIEGLRQRQSFTATAILGQRPQASK